MRNLLIKGFLPEMVYVNAKSVVMLVGLISRPGRHVLSSFGLYSSFQL
jgi:hypothetical protein